MSVLSFLDSIRSFIRSGTTLDQQDLENFVASRNPQNEAEVNFWIQKFEESQRKPAL